MYLHSQMRLPGVIVKFIENLSALFLSPFFFHMNPQERRRRVPLNIRIRKLREGKIRDLYEQMQSSIHEREKLLDQLPGEQETILKLQCYWLELNGCDHLSKRMFKTIPLNSIIRISYSPSSEPVTCIICKGDDLLMSAEVGGSSVLEFHVLIPGIYHIYTKQTHWFLNVPTENKLNMLYPSLYKDLEDSANLHLTSMNMEGNLPLVFVERLRRQCFPQVGYYYRFYRHF